MQNAYVGWQARYQDVLDAPEHKVAEIIGGQLHLSPRPGGPATAVASSIGVELGPPFMRGRGGPGGWLILDEPELHIGDDIVAPDLAGWRRERLPLAPDSAYFTVRPDWICEVLSPSTERLDRVEKMPLYATWGVEHAWLVHPRMRTIETFRIADGKWVSLSIYKDPCGARIEPFDAIEIDIASLWADIPLPSRVCDSSPQYLYEGY